jgi:hypothetical protein
MGGADGRLYELKYAAGRSAGCKKVSREPRRLQGLLWLGAMADMALAK